MVFCLSAEVALGAGHLDLSPLPLPFFEGMVFERACQSLRTRAL